MTYRKLLSIEHPDAIKDNKCKHCPSTYGYEAVENDWQCAHIGCDDCWNRDIPNVITIGEFVEQMCEDYIVSIYADENKIITQKWFGKVNEIPNEYIDIYTWSIFKCEDCTAIPNALNILIDTNETWL